MPRPDPTTDLIVVLGPTASGKTELALGLAERLERKDQALSVHQRRRVEPRGLTNTPQSPRPQLHRLLGRHCPRNHVSPRLVVVVKLRRVRGRRDELGVQRGLREAMAIDAAFEQRAQLAHSAPVLLRLQLGL